MDIYHVWCDLKSGAGDIEFSQAAKTYLQNLVDDGRMARFRITLRSTGEEKF